MENMLMPAVAAFTIGIGYYKLCSYAHVRYRKLKTNNSQFSLPHVAETDKKTQLTHGLRATAVRYEGPYSRKSMLSRKPHPRTKHHVDRQTGCKVMAIFVYPRWPSAVIYGLTSLTKHGVDRMHRLRDIRL